jgi:hypothetical protein
MNRGRKRIGLNSGLRSSFVEPEFMRHVPIAFMLPVTLISLGIRVALAQPPSPKPKSPGEIAAVSKLLAEKKEICRRQARKQKLHLFKRHRFIRDCVHKTIPVAGPMIVR